MSNDYQVIMFLSALVFFFVMKWLDDSLFYTIEKKCCAKHKGNCEECNCWSCKRLDYIERGDKN